MRHKVDTFFFFCKRNCFFLLLLLHFVHVSSFFLVHMSVLPACMPGNQERVMDPLQLESQRVMEPPCGCCKLNLGPPEERPVLLITEPSLQPLVFCVFETRSPYAFLNSLDLCRTQWPQTNRDMYAYTASQVLDLKAYGNLPSLFQTLSNSLTI